MEFFQENKKKFITIIVLFVLALLMSIVNNLNLGKNNYKYISNQDYVYTLDVNKNSKLPFINIDSESIMTINDKLKEDFYEIILYDDSYMNYEYSVHKDFISIVIEKGIKKDDDDFLDVEYITYNISLNDKRLLQDEEIFNKYHLYSSNVESIVENSLQEQYNFEVQEGYIPEGECNFTCYKNEKNYYSIDKNLQIYVDDNNKVNGYLNILRGSLYYTPVDVPDINTIFVLN